MPKWDVYLVSLKLFLIHNRNAMPEVTLKLLDISHWAISDSKRAKLMFTMSFISTAFATVLLGFSSVSSAKYYSTNEYPFPIQDPYVATLISAVNTSLTPFKIIKFEIRKDRRNVPLLEGRNNVPLALFEQKNQIAPLAFVIAGTGGTSFSGAALTLANQLYQQGYHVVTLPNPISWHYVLNVSESTLPGYPLRDAPEYYQFLQKVTRFLQHQQGLKISSFSLVGYSYGGLISGYLAKDDLSQKVFNFKKVIIINPPLNISHGLRMIDQYYYEGLKIPRDRKSVILGSAIAVGENILRNGFDINDIAKIITDLKLTRSETQWLIGENFRDSLKDVIYTSQQIKDLKILKTKATEGRKSERFIEAKKISYSSYFEKFVIPSLKNEKRLSAESTLATASENSNFYNLSEVIQSNKNIFVITNEDDFLLRADEDVAYLKKIVQDRLYLYPYGGHIGNLWFPINAKDFADIMVH